MRILYVLIALCVAQGNSELLGNIVGGVTNPLLGNIGGVTNPLLGNIVGGVTNTLGKVTDGTQNAVSGVPGIANDIIPVRISRSSDCSQDVRTDYRKAQNEFHTEFYNNVAAQSDNHFVYSPYPIWLTLSALTEGADPAIRSQLFAKLLLPQDACLRKSFYDIAIRIELPANDVTIANRRILVLDEGSRLNPAWHELVNTTGLIDLYFAPISEDPVALARIFQTYFSGALLSTDGSSIVLNSFDYRGLWTTGFTSTTEEPFYNDLRQQVGTVKMMRMKKRVRLAHLPFLNSKVVELPVGTDGRYTMLITVSLGRSFLKNSLGIFMSSIVQIFSLLQMSFVPIDIAIPQFAMSTEYDARPFLEEMGFGDYTNNPDATSYISSPPALPSSIIQRVSIHIDPDGLTKAPVLSDEGFISGAFRVGFNTATGVAAAVGRDFIANKPFMYTLFDTQTNTCIFAGAYSQPNA